MAQQLVVNCQTGQTQLVDLPDRNINDVKSSLWEAVKAKRDAVIDSGVTVSGIGVFDSDLISRTNISGATTGAIIAQMQSVPFTISWKLADNSVTTLDAIQMITVGTTILSAVAAAHARSQQLGIEIQEATTIEELDAIDIEAGW